MVYAWVVCTLLFSSLFGWHRPESVPEDIWNEVTPYLLPDNHPIKKTVLKLLSDQSFRVTESISSLEEAGFEETGTSHVHKFYVVKHKKLKNWLLKVYTDDAMGEKEWFRFLARCKGAEAAREAINLHNAEKYFRVPEKYLVPIPKSAEPHGNVDKKNFVLIVEYMNLHKAKDSYKKWKSRDLNKDFLTKYHQVVTTAGLADSFYIDNSPWGKDGKIAFIDLEQYHSWPIHYGKMLENLSHSMQAHWRQL